MRAILRYHLLLLALIVLGVGQAQQLPQLTQYQLNDYVINPAVAGSRPYFEFRSGHRSQWVGINDAPRTYVFSVATPIAENMGVGALLYTDVVGPTRRAGIQGSYAYHLKFTDKLKLGLALSGGLVQYEIDGSKITFHDPGDPVIDDQIRRDMVFDAKFGFHLYTDRFWLGATAPQLLQNDLAWLQSKDASLSKLEDHYYATAGYRFGVIDDLDITPSVLVKYVDPVPVKIDASIMFTYQDMFWLGGTWRSEDALAAMFGATVGQGFQFGYSYDMTTTALQQYANGSHEIMLGIRIDKKFVSIEDSEAGRRKAERKSENEAKKKLRKEAKDAKKLDTKEKPDNQKDKPEKEVKKKTKKKAKKKKDKKKKDKSGDGSDRDKAPDLIIE